MISRKLASLCSVFFSATLSAANYSEALSWNCSGCHGFEGRSVGSLTPSIAGMHPRLSLTMMRGYKLDERPSTVMGRIAKGYSMKELRLITEYFAKRPWKDAQAVASSEEVAIGQQVHDELCVECHDDSGRYQDKEIPRLAGQVPDYLLMQMKDYQDDSKRLPQPEKMRNAMQDLTQPELQALSRFYGSVRSGSFPDKLE